MKGFRQTVLAGMLMSALAACGGGSAPPPAPLPTETLFTSGNAWSGAPPAGAEQLSPEEFRRGVASGELVVNSPATLAAQKAAREDQYRQDRAFLQGVSDPSPALKSLLDEAAAHPGFEGDRPVTTPDGQTVVLFGLATQLHNAAESERLSQSVDNALAGYTLSYSLLPDTLKAQAVTPDSLRGQGLAEVQAALDSLDALIGTRPGSLNPARLEPGGGLRPQAIAPGNGTDNDGPCTPTNLVARYWFPLKNFVSPVKFQARRGSCWAFTAIGALESRERVQNNNAADLSEQFLMNKVKQDWAPSDYTDGGGAEWSLNTALSRGQVFPAEGSWTYNRATGRPRVIDGDAGSYAGSCASYSGTCSETAHQSRQVCATVSVIVEVTVCGFVGVTYAGAGVASGHSEQLWTSKENFHLNQFRLLLEQGHVLTASFPVYRGFMDDVKRDGVVSNYSMTQFGTVKENGKEVVRELPGSYGNHAVQIVGFLSNADLTTFGTTPNIGGGGYFIVKNSWGCGAGDGGYYYLPADYVSRFFNSLSVLNFDTRRSDAWNREQARPGGSVAPKIEIKNPAVLGDLRVEKELTAFFRVSHPVAKSVTLTVTSDKDGTVYSGPWSTDTGALSGSSLKLTFSSVGSRTLSLLATYGSGQAQATMSVTVINTAPALTLEHTGDPRQGEDYLITALITDRNEASAGALCSTTSWAVDGADALSAATGCQVRVKFASTGSRQVRVTTRDSEGATGSQTLSLNVLPPPINPYPRLVSAGVFSRDLRVVPPGTIGATRCVSNAVSGGQTITLGEDGCSEGVIARLRYFAGATVENPSNEALTYDWNLYATGTSEALLYSAAASTKATFDLYDPGNTALVTNPCRITLKVNAPDPSRSKGPTTVWIGRCTYHAIIVR